MNTKLYVRSSKKVSQNAPGLTCDRTLEDWQRAVLRSEQNRINALSRYHAERNQAGSEGYKNAHAIADNIPSVSVEGVKGVDLPQAATPENVTPLPARRRRYLTGFEPK